MSIFRHEIVRNIPILFPGPFSSPFYARPDVRRRRKPFCEGIAIFLRPVFPKFGRGRRKIVGSRSCGTYICGGCSSATEGRRFIAFPLDLLFPPRHSLITPEFSIHLNPLFGTFSRPADNAIVLRSVINPFRVRFPPHTVGTQTDRSRQTRFCLRPLPYL